MKRRAWMLVLCWLGCGPAPGYEPEPPTSPVPEDGTGHAEPGHAANGTFASYRDGLVDELLAADPQWGRQVGLHQYDGKLFDYSDAGIQQHIARLQKAVRTLEAFEQTPLDDDDALDLAILKNEIERLLFFLTETRNHETEPRFYQELFSISGYLDFDYAPLDQRAHKLVEHEEAALKQTKYVLANLRSTLSKAIVETSIKSYAGFAEYLRGDVRKLLEGVGDAAFQARFAKANDALANEAEIISKRLREEWLPRADDESHVLGVDRFTRFVAAQEGRDIDLAAFKAMAEADLARNKAAYQALIKKGVKPTRPKQEQLLEAATRLMNESRQFVIDRQLVTIPSDDRCTLKESPPFQRWNAAFLNMPGPFDTAKQAYYYITLPDPKWPKKEQEEYVFPWGVLQATTVHEVYPGHFLHGLWIRNAKSKVQKIVSSYSFTEGWAHYTEQLMIEEGFRTDDEENILGQLSDALLRNCRFVASIGIHTEGVSLEEVERRFRDDCMQDKATAREQAARGTFDPGYFAYTLGKVQILELREALKKELGDRFDLQRFHDALLSYGAPPIALIAERVAKTVRDSAASGK